MANLMTVIPYTPAFRDWLDDFGVTPPTESGCFPSPRELMAVLATLPGLHVTVESCTSAHIRVTDQRDPQHGPWAMIIMPWSGDLDAPDALVPQEFSFEGGWDSLQHVITDELARVCGPLALVSGSDGVPHLFPEKRSGEPIE